MAWTESGLFYTTMRDLLKGSLTSVSWLTNTDKISLASASATPDFFGTGTATWSNTAEVTGGANWPTGGVAFSAAASGGADISAAFSHTGPGPSTLVYSASPVSVATTTTTAPAFGAYLYAAAQSPQAMFLGIWFGGSGYSTVNGTFAITWNAAGIMTMQMAA